MDYNDSNRAFLQAFLSRSTLTLDTAKPILAAILSIHQGREVLANDVTVDDLDAYIAAANSAISPLDLEIRSTLHQQTRERYYALVNTTSDALTQLATTYTADEIAFVKRVLDAMFDGQNNKGRREAMCLSGMEAVQLAKPNNRREMQNGATQATAASQGLSMRDAETMMARLVEEGWFDKSAKGFYSLSPRGLMELKGWLVETYNDPADEDGDEPRRDKIKFCNACRDIITVVWQSFCTVRNVVVLTVSKGQRCSQRECSGRLHDICTQNFFRSQRSQTCPVCKSEWDGKHFVGEKAITTSESYLKGRRGGGSGGRKVTEANVDGGGHSDE
jgi:hypothetical protein